MRPLKRKSVYLLLLNLWFARGAAADGVAHFTPHLSAVSERDFKLDLTYQGKSLGVRVMSVRGPGPMSHTRAQYEAMMASGDPVSQYTYKREHFAELILNFGTDNGKLLLSAFSGDTGADLNAVFLKGLSPLCAQTGFKYASGFEFDHDPREYTLLELLADPDLRDMWLSWKGRYSLARTMMSDLLIVVPESTPPPFDGYNDWTSVCLVQAGDRAQGGSCLKSTYLPPQMAIGIHSVTCTNR